MHQVPHLAGVKVSIISKYVIPDDRFLDNLIESIAGRQQHNSNESTVLFTYNPTIHLLV